MDTIPFYRIAYVKRRNNYCLDHMQSEKPASGCAYCRYVCEGTDTHGNKIKKNKLTIYSFDNCTVQSQMIEYAALLEYQMAEGILTVEQARREFCEIYPESNCLPDWKAKFDKSVLSLIIPYPGSLRDKLK